MEILDRLFRRAPSPASGLTAEGLLQSDLWLDQPDALRRIEARLRRGRLDAEEAEKLGSFARDGYLTFPLAVDPGVYADVAATVEQLWREKPADVAYAYHSILRPFSFADEAAERRPSYRIADLHAVSAGALALYLDSELFRWVRLVLGQEPVATQSLYFEYGSQQSLHRDPVFVETRPPSHLVAAWIALEDIDPRSGPLAYVPGSHRLPYYQLAPGEHRFDHRRHGEAEIRAMAEWDRRQMEERGLGIQAFTPRRGEVLLWHHSLLHGGSTPEEPSLTRRSFVVHFSTRAHFTRLKQTYLERLPAPDGTTAERRRIVETDRLLSRDGCWGFASPLAEARRRPGAGRP
jgi:ectoine hydroxylase-related dioxygenase (phytanoyl-CoA dioxygenase family)